MSGCEHCLAETVATSGSAGLGPLLLQVLGLGLLWTTLHCSGMCGPLVASLRFGVRSGVRTGARNSARGDSRSGVAAAVDLLCYQGGRALMYAVFGAIAGGVGLVARATFERWSPILILVLALAFLVAAARSLGWLGRPGAGGAGIGAALTRLAGRVVAIAPAHPHLRAGLLGAALAAMPCMLLFWVLSLAAASGHPAHGALLMVLLVALTTPVLLAAAVLPATLGRLRRVGSRWAAPASLTFSAVWMALAGLAGLGVLPHLHFALGRYTVMFW